MSNSVHFGRGLRYQRSKKPRLLLLESEQMSCELFTLERPRSSPVHSSARTLRSFLVGIEHQFCDRSHKLDGCPCFRICHIGKPRTTVTGARFVPQGVDRASEFEHGSFDFALGCFAGHNRMLRSYKPHGHKRLTKQSLKIGVLRVSSMPFNKDMSCSGFQKVFPCTSEKSGIVSATLRACSQIT